MKRKSRGNGQGSAYRRGRTWTAQVVVGWRIPEDDTKHLIPIKRTKSGFETKREALAYCPVLLQDRSERPRMALEQVFNEWSIKYTLRVSASTMAGYKAAYLHFKPLHAVQITHIVPQDLQDCMDACPAGKRTHQMMKVVAGLIWAYAIDCNYVDRDITTNLYTGKGQSVQREPLTDDEVETIRQAIGREPYAEYIYALCYLGFRPGEFLKLKKADLHEEAGLMYLVGGSKTDAGKNRRVPVPDVIRPIIRNRLDVAGTDLLFPQLMYRRTGEFDGYKAMTDSYFRKFVFKPLMKKLKIAEGKVPYSARHTYSDKLKNAAGDVKAKAAIIGHTDYDFTRKRYQSTDLADLKEVSDSIK